MTIWLVSTILIITLYLLISEKIPVDLTAIGIMAALMISRVLTPTEAVAGFAHPAVITVGAMFLVSKGLVRTGAVGYIGQKVIAIARGNANLAVLVILLTVAVASAFINNTPVVVLFYSGGDSDVLPVWSQPVKDPHTVILHLHIGRHLHADRNLNQYYYQ